MFGEMWLLKMEGGFREDIDKTLYCVKKMILNDDDRKSTVSYTTNTRSQQYLHNRKREDLTESIGMVPAEYPSKVKLELLTTLEC